MKHSNDENFVDLRNRLISNFNELDKNNERLFEVELDKDELWNLYLDSFPKGTNNLYRKRREYDCSCCRHFVKTIGNVVFVKNNELKTIWGFDTGSNVYQPVVDALDSYVKSKSICNIFYTYETLLGTKSNKELKDGVITQYDHFYLNVPIKYVKDKYEIDTLKGDFKNGLGVFKRSLNEITDEAVDTVLELISQGSLYRGDEWKSQLKSFKNIKKEYNTLSEEEKELYVWNNFNTDNIVTKIRNTSIGTLLVNISEGMILDTAVRKFEQIVAPTNYKRSKPIYTKKMLEDAKKTIVELGYNESLQRRFATVDDITVNNILFANRDTMKHMGTSTSLDDIFGSMEKTVAVDPKKFSKVEEITIDKFINDVLPTASDVEVLFENRLSNNLVSLITSQNKDAKSMFKWDNSFSWAYTGNIADSMMKERVKLAGGKVDGDLRFSIQWNEEGLDNCDMDAHCTTPYNDEIYYGHKRDISTGGMLDVDIIQPGKKIAVENITWNNRAVMKDGKYLFFVNQYGGNGKKGFRAEIEFDGNIYSFDYNRPTHRGENIKVATVTLENGNFTIKELLPSSTSSREVWGLSTNQFVPVKAIMYSPNYWDLQDGIGNKHYMFMLKDCVNPEQPNGWYNEYLSTELNKHRKVFEALGSKLAVVDSEHQLSGVGFSSTIRNEIIVKVKGQTERILKVKI